MRIAESNQLICPFAVNIKNLKDFYVYFITS